MLCPLEADHDQVGSVVPGEVEGKSAANGCTRSLGGMETPGAREVARIPVCAVKGVSETPSVEETPCVSGVVTSVVPGCVVKCVSENLCVEATPCMSETPCVEETPCVSGVVVSVPECVLPSTPCMKGEPQPETARVCEARCVNETPRVSAPVGVGSVVCVSEARCVSERPSVRRTACVRSLCEREMSVGMHEHTAASPGVSTSVMSWCASLVTRGSLSARVERRRRLRHLRDKSRVAAVVAIGTVPGLHGSERVVRAVQRMRPPRARLRE